MKHTLAFGSLALIVLYFSPAGLGQSSFVFSNSGKPVFDAYGVRLVGANYLAELYGGASPELLEPLVDISSGVRAITTLTGITQASLTARSWWCLGCVRIVGPGCKCGLGRRG
jgi:hypothetical protein